jgi:predicted secreted protein
MLDPVLNIAIFIIWWWIALFAVLPIGVRPVEELEAHPPGHERGAPVSPNLLKKALWAAGLAAVLWAITAGLVALDPFKISG